MTTSTNNPVESLAAYMGTRMGEVVNNALDRGATDEQAAEAAIEWATQAVEYLTQTTIAR